MPIRISFDSLFALITVFLSKIVPFICCGILLKAFHT